MANFTEIKTGGWADEDVLTGAQITALQAALVKCANFTEGSTHEPTNPVVVNGAGILGLLAGFFQLDFQDLSGSQTVAMTKSMAVLFAAAPTGSTLAITTTDVPAGTFLLVKNNGAGSLEVTVGGIIVDAALGVGSGALYIIKTSGQGEKFL